MAQLTSTGARLRQQTQQSAELARGLRRERDRANAATEAKSRFLANMSHEIRTPMNGVMGMLNLLMETGLDAHQYRLAKTAKRSADDLLSIIDDILDDSKLEAGRVELETMWFDPRQISGGVHSLFADRARAKGLEFVCDCPDDLPVGLIGDPTRLRQVVLNLVGNAIKFTEAGGVALALSHRPLDARRVEIGFEVRDTGIGIPADVIDNLFSRFTQADSTTTRKYGGTGLSLAISRQLVELMGGRIEIESEPGQGSRFRFAIILNLADASTNGSAHEGAALAASACGLRLLVAEDHDVNQVLIATILGNQDTSSMSSPTAWKRWRRSPPGTTTRC